MTIGRPRQATGIARADADFVTSAGIAVDYLVELGHRRIGFLCTGQDATPMFGFQWYSLSGFRKAHRAHGLSLRRRRFSAMLGRRRRDYSCMLPCSTVASVHGIGDDDLHRGSLVMQIFLLADTRARRRFDHRTGRSAIVGANRAAVTVVRFSPTDLTRVAVDLLVRMLEGRQPAHVEELVPVELVVRGSTGPPIPAARQRETPQWRASYLAENTGVNDHPAATHERR